MMSLVFDLESGVERVSERHIAPVAGQCGPHLARHVRITDAGLGIRKAERTTGSRRAERASTAERPGGGRLHEAQRELDSARFHTFVVKPMGGRNRGGGQQVQRPLMQTEL